MLLIFSILVLLFSVIVHEISHGYVALKLGDPTAKLAGRLTLNPIKHLDPFGSLILPLMLAILHAPIIGWAKPVPYNPRNLPNPKKGAGLIALAGPLTNLFLAVFFAFLIRLLIAFPFFAAASQLAVLFSFVVQINLLLAIFNLLPIPPLDGSGILFSLLPRGWYMVERFLRQYGFFILLFLIFFGLNFLGPVVNTIYNFLVGI